MSRVIPVTIICSIAALLGCSGKSASNVKVHGTVTVGGTAADAGQVRFVPLDGVNGPVGIADVSEGKYEIIARGGVPSGRHRIEVEALRKTGRKIAGKPPFSAETVDELLPFGAPTYRGESSPLMIDTADSPDGKFDIEIPAN
jgi:hypothetical protein